MDFELTEGQKIFREAIKQFAEKEIAPLVNEAEEKEKFPVQLFPMMGDLGYLGIAYSPEYGGADMGKMGECIAVEEFGRICMGIASGLMIQSGLATSSIYAHGSEAQKQRYLVPAIKGRKIAAFGLTEPNAGSDAAARSLGLTMAAYEASLEYAKDRKQFGQPIGRFQSIAFKLARMALDIEAARWLVYHAAWLYDAGKRCGKEAVMAKLFNSEMAQRVTGEAMQIHGGYGFTTDSPIQRYFRDARLGITVEGISEIQQLVISGEIGVG